MTRPAEISPTFSVAGQLRPEDLAGLAEAGFTTIICNRPDGEDFGQPDAETMRGAAEQAGLEFHHIPVTGGMFTPQAIADFTKARRASTGRTLAYCRTGNRSAALDALANPDELTIDERLEAAGRNGYDLSGLREWMTE